MAPTHAYTTENIANALSTAGILCAEFNYRSEEIRPESSARLRCELKKNSANMLQVIQYDKKTGALHIPHEGNAISTILYLCGIVKAANMLRPETHVTPK